jgi:uncharacterized protein
MWKLSFVVLALVGAGLAIIASCSRSEDKSSPAEDQKMLQVVVHVNFSDTERQDHGLKNVENILKDVKDAKVEVLCHGAGIALLVKERTKHAEEIEKLTKQGVRFAACENTMREKGIKRKTYSRA